MTQRYAGFADPFFENAVYVREYTFQECYPDGKGETCTSGDPYYIRSWRADRMPVYNLNNTISLPQCDGTIETLTPKYGGTFVEISLFTSTLLKWCPNNE